MKLGEAKRQTLALLLLGLGVGMVLNHGGWGVALCTVCWLVAGVLWFYEIRWSRSPRTTSRRPESPWTEVRRSLGPVREWVALAIATAGAAAGIAYPGGPGLVIFSVCWLVASALLFVKIRF